MCSITRDTDLFLRSTFNHALMARHLFLRTQDFVCDQNRPDVLNPVVQHDTVDRPGTKQVTTKTPETFSETETTDHGFFACSTPATRHSGQGKVVDEQTPSGLTKQNQPEVLNPVVLPTKVTDQATHDTPKSQVKWKNRPAISAMSHNKTQLTDQATRGGTVMFERTPPQDCATKHQYMKAPNDAGSLSCG